MTEEFIGVNSLMVAKQELRGIYAPVKKPGFAPKRVCVWCLARRWCSWDVKGVHADSTARMWEPSDRG